MFVVHVCLLSWLHAPTAFALSRPPRLSTSTSYQPHKVAWVHIPKCGTTFGTTLVHYANSTLPKKAAMELDTKSTPPGEIFSAKYPPDYWFRGLMWNKRYSFADHTEITDRAWAQWNGHFFAMVRKPDRRTYSSWVYFTNSSVDPAKYARLTFGTATKMLAGQVDGLRVYQTSNIQPDLPKALDRLRGFKFIGLTDEWNLSICLFHAMFGGECLPKEFEDMRPTAYDESASNPFKKYPDVPDEILYRAAERFYRFNLNLYGVTSETCKKICPTLPHIRY